MHNSLSKQTLELRRSSYYCAMLEPKRALDTDVDNDARLGLKDLLIIYTMKQTIEGDHNAVVGLLTAVRSTTAQSGTYPRLEQQTNKYLLCGDVSLFRHHYANSIPLLLKKHRPRNSLCNEASGIG